MQQRLPVAAGTATLTVFLAAAVLLPKTTREVLRDSAFDIELAGDQWLRRPAPSDLKVIVVDIDRASIDALGAWPWPRETMARLVEAVATGRPAAIAIDVLFAEPDDRSPAALARRLGSVTGRAEISALGESLPDGDKRLARAIGSVPVALGFVLDPDRHGTLPGAAVASRGSLPFDDLWQAAGAIGPPLPLAAAASGLGALSLPGSADGAIRQVPVFVAAGRVLMPGLAAEALRLASGVSSYLIEGEPPTLVVGSRRVALSRDGLLRLVPVAPWRRVARTLSAIDVLEGRADGGRLAGALVLLGGSPPELGGLRKTPADPLTPSVQIQADAVEQLLAGRVPRTLVAAPHRAAPHGPADRCACCRAWRRLVAGLRHRDLDRRDRAPLDRRDRCVGARRSPRRSADPLHCGRAGVHSDSRHRLLVDAPAGSVRSPSARTAPRAGGRPPHRRTTGPGQAQWRAA